MAAPQTLPPDPLNEDDDNVTSSCEYSAPPEVVERIGAWLDSEPPEWKALYTKLEERRTGRKSGPKRR